METDTKFYEILKAHPEWIQDMMNQPKAVKATFDSITTKRVELRLDGVWQAEDATLPMLAVEFQFYLANRKLYSSVARKMLALEHLNPGKTEAEIQGVIFFGHRRLDTEASRWRHNVRVFYLDKEMALLAKRDPQHPLPKLLSPIFEKSDAKLESQAKVIYDALKSSPNSSPSQVQTLCEVFYALLIGRFKNKTHQEISAMLILPDITKTRAGRELIEMGKAEGKAEGKAGFACKVLTHRFGKLPKSVAESIMHLDYLQLEKLEDKVLEFPDLKALKHWLAKL